MLLALAAACSMLLAAQVTVRSAQVATLAASIAVSGDGRLLASGGWSGGEHGTIQIWDLATGRMTRTLRGGAAENFLGVAFSPDGRWLVSGGDSFGVGMVRVWDLVTEGEPRTFTVHRGPVLATISPDGRWLVSSGNGVGVWEFATGRKIVDHSFATHSSGAAVTPDGELVVFAADDELAVLEVATDRLVRTLRGHTGDVYSIAISADGRWIVSGGADRVIRVWELTSGRGLRTLRDHAGSVESVAISPDGRWLVSGSADRTIKIWELGTGRLVRTLTGHLTDVSSVAVTPDGRWIVSAGGDVKVWELATGRLLRTLHHAPTSHRPQRSS